MIRLGDSVFTKKRLTVPLGLKVPPVRTRHVHEERWFRCGVEGDTPPPQIGT